MTFARAFGRIGGRTEGFVKVSLWVGGRFGMVQIKGLVFGDDLFQLQFDARGILLPGKMDEFIVRSDEPVVITMVLAVQ